MAGFRDLVIRVTNRAAGVIPPAWLKRLTGQRLILPMYHVISDADLPHIRHLYPVKGTRAFEADLDFLLRHYEPIDPGRFMDLAMQDREPDQPSFLLSFDDGLREFHDVIAPILLRKGVPAICFLNSAFMDNEALFYRYKASLLIDLFDREPDLLRTMEIPGDFRGFLLSVSYSERELLDKIAGKAGFRFDRFLAEQRPYLESGRVRSLKEQGFYFGAHSIDHPEYQFLDFGEQVRQTEESVREICGRFDLDYKLFAFPFTDHRVSQKFFDLVQERDIADLTFGCAGQKRDSAVRHFQRIPFEMADIPGGRLHNAELLYYLLKMPFGKNRVARS